MYRWIICFCQRVIYFNDSDQKYLPLKKALQLLNLLALQNFSISNLKESAQMDNLFQLKNDLFSMLNFLPLGKRKHCLFQTKKYLPLKKH